MFIQSKIIISLFLSIEYNNKKMSFEYCPTSCGNDSTTTPHNDLCDSSSSTDGSGNEESSLSERRPLNGNFVSLEDSTETNYLLEQERNFNRILEQKRAAEQEKQQDPIDPPESFYEVSWAKLHHLRKEIIREWMLSEARHCSSFPQFPKLIRHMMELLEDATIKQLGKQMHAHPGLLYKTFLCCRGNYPLGKYVTEQYFGKVVYYDKFLSRGNCREWYGFPHEDVPPLPQCFNTKSNGIIVLANVCDHIFVLEGNHKISAIVTHNQNFQCKVYCINCEPIIKHPPHEGQFESLLRSEEEEKQVPMKPAPDPAAAASNTDKSEDSNTAALDESSKLLQQWQSFDSLRQKMIQCWLLTDAMESKSFSHYPSVIRQQLELPINALRSEVIHRVESRPDLLLKAFMYCRGNYPIGKYALDVENTTVHAIETIMSRHACANFFGFPKPNTPRLPSGTLKPDEHCIVLATDFSDENVYVLAGSHTISAMVIHDDPWRLDCWMIKFNDKDLFLPPNEGQFKVLVPELSSPPTPLTMSCFDTPTITIPPTLQPTVVNNNNSTEVVCRLSPFAAIILSLAVGYALYQL